MVFAYYTELQLFIFIDLNHPNFVFSTGVEYRAERFERNLQGLE